MEDRSWTFVDKSSWARGPWDQEPDKVQWVDQKTGLPALVVRGPWGALCGYVGVPENHPAVGRLEDLKVHGGVTYGPSPCEGGERGICHLPGEGEPDHVFWIGFDCSHYGDRVPGSSLFSDWGVYRDLTYVRGECEKMAKQIREMEKC